MFLKETRQQVETALSEEKVEEIDPRQLKIVINLLLEYVKSLRCLVYLENLQDDVTTQYKVDRCESILGVLHKSPNSREHYVSVANFTEKR